MHDWLGKIDPNYVLAGVSAIAGWIWHRHSTVSRDDLTTLVRGLLSQEAARIVGDKLSHTTARECLAKAAWSGLAIARVPRNAVTQRLVSALVEQTLGELTPKLLELQLMDLASRAESVAFSPSERPTVPKLDLDMTAELPAIDKP